MILNYIIAATLFFGFGWGTYLLGKKAGESKFKDLDKNDDGIPDFLQKGGRPKGSKNKKK